MDQPLTSEQIKELLKLDYEKREKAKGSGTAITGLVGVGSGVASHHILRKDNTFFRHLPKVGIAGGLILTGMGLGRLKRIKDKEKAREKAGETSAVAMSARDEFQEIVFGHMEDEEPTDRTKRAREISSNTVGNEVPPKRMRKLFAEMREGASKAGKAVAIQVGKVKMSAREQLDTILFANDPRPRDSQGQFTDANGNMIDPNSIAVAYNKPPQAQPQEQDKPEEEQDKPEEEESKAKKLISKLNKKKSDMKQSNMSAREELGMIRFGAYSLGDRLVQNAVKRGFAQEELRKGILRPSVATATEKIGSIDYTGLPKSLQSTKPRFKSTVAPSGKKTEYVATPGSGRFTPEPPSMRYELPRTKEPVGYSAREELDMIRFGIKPFFKAKFPGGPMKKYTGEEAEYMARLHSKDMFPEMLRENAMKRKMAAGDFDDRMQMLKKKRSMT